MPKVEDDASRPPEVQEWIDAELKEQQVRYETIVQEMNIDLAPQRDIWVQEFFERLQTRGTNVHSDMMRVVKKDEIPVRPDRPFKVVF